MTDEGQRLGRIITFYSYKGGVGRSMAVANTAALLSRKYKVLAVDFDLEAPGLHRYFLSQSTSLAERRYEPQIGPAGVIEFFSELQDRLRSLYPDGLSESPEAEEIATVRQMLRSLLATGRYEYRVRLGNPDSPDPAANSELFFMPACRFDEGYAARVQAFDWRAFYLDYAAVFPLLAEELGARYDYILIDSRTGLTDIGSVCTVLLPSVLVLVFVPNEQSLHGVIEVGRQAIQRRTALTGSNSLSLLPLLCRLEDAEDALLQGCIRDATLRFERLLLEVKGTLPLQPADYFRRIRVFYKSRYAYGELIAAEREPTSAEGSMAKAFADFTRLLLPPEGLILIAVAANSLTEVVRASVEKLGLQATQILVDFSTAEYLEPAEQNWLLLATQLRDHLKKAVEDAQYERLHLFYRGPVVLGPLVGAMTAPYKPLAIYYFDDGRYRLAYELDRALLKSQGRQEAARPEPAGYRRGILLVSVGGDSLLSTVRSMAEELGLGQTPILLDFTNPGYLRPSPGEWRQVAEHLAAKVNDLVGDPFYEEFDLFYRGPVVLGPLLGALIAPHRRLNVYHFENARYSLAYHLDRRFLRSTSGTLG
jgi:MinD-like ATPase involved in chromosome partitioning or flagellar assembly